MAPTLKDMVIQYRAEHLSIFPLPYKSKRDDRFKWGEFQKRLATDAEISQWFNGHQSNIAVVCGQVSGGLVVVEFDNPDYFDEFNANFTVMTGNSIEEFTRVTKGKRGPHVWLRVKVPVKSLKTPKCEIRSEGNYIVVPPSVHPDGPEYQFLSALPIKEIDSLREVGIDLSQQPQGMNQPGWVSDLLRGVGKGERNASAVKLAGYFRDRIPIDVTERLMIDWNGRNSPPLPMNEVMTTVASVYRYPEKPTGSLVRTNVNGGVIGGENPNGPENEPFDSGELVTGVTKRNKAQQTTTNVTSITSVTNITQDGVKAYLEESDGQWIEYRDLDNDLGIRFPEQKAERRVIIQRLLKIPGFIEKHPLINTKIRRLKSDLTRMTLDFERVTSPMPLTWPFGIESKVDLFGKSLAVIAGTKDAGKTAFLLNFARKNCDVGKVHYFNSEMGDVELMNRLRNFEDYRDWAGKVDWIERAAGFEDVIYPDDINLIDFLEITNEFYLVGSFLAAIYRKLGPKGIAVVALQKDPRTQYGRGGTFSVEKARLYLTMNHVAGQNTATIESGKMWHLPGDNPRGQYVNYKLVKGCVFTNVSLWNHPRY